MGLLDQRETTYRKQPLPDDRAPPTTPKHTVAPAEAGQSPRQRAAPAGQRMLSSPLRGGWQQRGQLPAPESWETAPGRLYRQAWEQPPQQPSLVDPPGSHRYGIGLWR